MLLRLDGSGFSFDLARAHGRSRWGDQLETGRKVSLLEASRLRADLRMDMLPDPALELGFIDAGSDLDLKPRSG